MRTGGPGPREKTRDAGTPRDGAACRCGRKKLRRWATQAAPRFVAPMRLVASIGIVTPRRPLRPTSRVFSRDPRCWIGEGAGAQDWRWEIQASFNHYVWTVEDRWGRGSASPQGEARRECAAKGAQRPRREDYGGGGWVGFDQRHIRQDILPSPCLTCPRQRAAPRFNSVSTSFATAFKVSKTPSPVVATALKSGTLPVLSISRSSSTGDTAGMSRLLYWIT